MTDNSYDDIINMPHHVSKNHPQMTIYNRAAQFSSFAALTGYEEAIKETARMTDEKIELDENMKNELDRVLMFLHEHQTEHPEVKITYFKKDEIKSGGSYETVTGNLKKIDTYAKKLVLTNELVISIIDIVKVEEK